MDFVNTIKNPDQLKAAGTKFVDQCQDFAGKVKSGTFTPKEFRFIVPLLLAFVAATSFVLPGLFSFTLGSGWSAETERDWIRMGSCGLFLFGALVHRSAVWGNKEQNDMYKVTFVVFTLLGVWSLWSFFYGSLRFLVVFYAPVAGFIAAYSAIFGKIFKDLAK